MSNPGYTRYRPVCIISFTSYSPIHIMETRSIQQKLGCIPNKLKSNLCIRFPPLVLKGRVLRKIQQDQSSMTIITLAWQTQSWFQGCIWMLVRALLVLPERKNLLKDPAGNYHPAMQENSLKLMSWTISWKAKRPREFLEGDQTLPIPGAQVYLSITNWLR